MTSMEVDLKANRPLNLETYVYLQQSLVISTSNVNGVSISSWFHLGWSENLAKWETKLGPEDYAGRVTTKGAQRPTGLLSSFSWKCPSDSVGVIAMLFLDSGSEKGKHMDTQRVVQEHLLHLDS